jgi:hypothetical protein
MIVLVLIWVLHAPMVNRHPTHPVAVLLAVVATGAIASLVRIGLPLPAAVAAMSLPVGGLVAAAVLNQHRGHKSAQQC